MSYSDAIAHRVETLSQSAIISGVTPLAGRVLLAAIFLISGISKISDPAGTIGYITMVGLPFPTLAYGAAVMTEILGGIALILGFQTRIVALILAGFSVATALAFHNNLSDLNQFIHFFKNISMAGGFLQVVAFGAGRYSLDARR
ncbi:DoxX family protein [Agrobacterium pusense]|jgi:putative oxidoreductase|uniref:DoxX family protein n=1 Tax=Agrobacterium pusense TaxID=648995 RepID=UPI002452F40D|nr:DoxX family protein [Agrobacterium pusense]